MTAEAVDCFRPVPDEARRSWREHWGLFAATADGKTAVLVHISADPIRREGTFTVVIWADGKRWKDIHKAPVPTQLSEITGLSSDRLQFKVTKPGQAASVHYSGAEIALELEYTTRFVPHRAPPATACSLFPVENEQQSVTVTGSIMRGGAGQPFSGMGSRDHSWGWFPERAFRSHDWISISLEDRFVHFAHSERTGGETNAALFVLDESGEHGLVPNQMRAPYWREDCDAHLPTLDRDHLLAVPIPGDEKFGVWLRLSQAVARHHSNRRDRELHRIYEQVTLFCPAQTTDGQHGVALVELGKLLERNGVCDEAIPGVSTIERS